MKDRKYKIGKMNDLLIKEHGYEYAFGYMTTFLTDLLSYYPEVVDNQIDIRLKLLEERFSGVACCI